MHVTTDSSLPSLTATETSNDPNASFTSAESALESVCSGFEAQNILRLHALADQVTWSLDILSIEAVGHMFQSAFSVNEAFGSFEVAPAGGRW